MILKELNLLKDLREHKFKHSFQDTINPFIFSSTVPSLLMKDTLLSTICSLDSKLLDCTDYVLTQALFLATHPKFQAVISKSLTYRLIISYQLRDLRNHFFK